MSNVSGVRRGTGGGPTVVFCAHMDTVFPEGTDLKVKREGDILRAPGIGDDTSNLMATLEMFRALNRGAVKAKGDLIFLASAQEELGLLGARHWLEGSGYKPDMFIAVDVGANQVWYGALRITQFKLFYTSPGAHTMESRGGPSTARAVAQGDRSGLCHPAPADRRRARHLQASRGECRHAQRRHGHQRGASRSLVHGGSPLARYRDPGTTQKAVEDAARRAANRKALAFGRKEQFVDYTKARPKQERCRTRSCRPRSQPPIISDSRELRDRARRRRINRPSIAVTMGIPAVAIGAVLEHGAHRLEETADASSIVPGIKSLISLAVALTRSMTDASKLLLPRTQAASAASETLPSASATISLTTSASLAENS